MTLALFQIICPFPLHHIFVLSLSSFPVCWSISRVFVCLSAGCDSSDCYFQHLFRFSSSSASFWLVCLLPTFLSPSVFFPVGALIFSLLFPHSHSVALLLSSPIIYPLMIFILSPSCFFFPSLPLIWSLDTFFMWLSALLFTSSVHLSIHLFPCNFPSHPTATFPFHLSPKWVHSLVFGPLKYQGFSNLFLWHDFYLLSTCMEPSCPMPTCLFPSHRSSFPYFLLFMVSSPLHLYLCSHSPALSIIHSYLDIFFLILIL